MKNILISWQAYNNDFVIQKGVNGDKKIGLNEDGPTCNLHRYFWEEGNYERHILLNGNDLATDKKAFQLLVSELKTLFPRHHIEPQDIFITDPIDVSEIFSKLQSLLAEFGERRVDIFISPGTPAMQTAWYLLGTNYRANVTLFQLRHKRFNKEKSAPEKIIVSLDSAMFPTNVIVAQKSIEKPVIEGKLKLTPSIEPIYKMAGQIAMTDDVGCLILGENGTGKENVARFIHENSNRKSKPFIAINCAAYTDELLRSELFGYNKGAFTDAKENKEGVFEAADQGTIFLDEIGDISPKMQVSLLRVLQEKKIQRIGSTRDVPINVRVISATNRDLEESCENEQFRWDLFFRLSVTTLKLPSLRERGRNEISQYIKYFNDRCFSKFPNRKNKLNISSAAMDMLLSYGYKGNLRELEHLFISLYTFCESEVAVEDLPERIRLNKSPLLKLEDVEKRHIMEVFKNNQGNILVSSKILGITRDTLKRKLDQYGLRNSV